MQGLNPTPGTPQAEQKNAPKSSRELLEVHRSGAQDGIERIAGNALQAVALQPMFHLEMSDAEFDRVAARARFIDGPRRYLARSVAASAIHGATKSGTGGTPTRKRRAASSRGDPGYILVAVSRKGDTNQRE